MNTVTDNPTPPSAEAVLDEVVTALRRGDSARAEKALAEAAERPPAQALVRLAELNMRRRRWQDSVWLFDQAAARDGSADLKRCLSRNLACLQEHRPALYEQLVNLPAGGRYSVTPSATGRPTVVYQIEAAGAVSLSPGNDPEAGSAVPMDSLRPFLEKGQSIALCGAGDGYLLTALSEDKTPLMLGMRQPVFVLEADAQVLLHGMMIHDYTAPHGPIRDNRFFWFVGPDWAQELEAAVLANPYLGCPVVAVPLGVAGAEMRVRLQQVALAVSAADTAAGERIAARYAASGTNFPADFFAFGPGDAGAPRRPKVLLLTTRFSSVLQYSTRDAAEAFRALGWEAYVVIEPSAEHRLYRPAIRRELEEFQPDLVFQIDHLRHEHGDMFPPNLPFACWIQDHLPNLTSEAAGARVGPRDFVLVGMPTMYVHRYGYPRRQCLALTKLTRVPPRPASWRADGEDLVYVSSASQQPRDVARELLASYTPSPAAYNLVAEVCRRMIELYGRGVSLPTHHDVRLFLEAVEADLGFAVEKPNDRRTLIDALFDRLGNVLYRQQSLAWAAAATKKHGLRLGIYGPGWDTHPDFAPYARGPVTYGADLENLTRASRINLALEPFFATSHQRLLDGLAAGGFFLVRHHPMHRLVPQLERFLASHAPEGATVGEVRQAVRAGGGRVRGAEFEELLGRCASLSEFGDPIEFVRNQRRAGLLGDGEEPLPGLSAVSFCDDLGMERRIVEFLADDGKRAETARRQRESVELRLSYAAGLARVVSEIGRLLKEGSPVPSPAPETEPAGGTGPARKEAA